MTHTCQNFIIVKFCQEAEMFQDMTEAIKEVVILDSKLNSEQIKLLAGAYKQLLAPKQEALRKINAIEFKQQFKNSQNLNLIRAYKLKIYQQLKNISFDIINLLNLHLIPNAKNVEAYILYLKMQGDYFRYLAQYQTDEVQKNNQVKYIKDSYKKALAMAYVHLKPTNTIKIGVAVNYAVFLYDIQNDPTQACRVAKTAFDNAIQNIEKADDEQYEETTTILQVLRDSMTLWTCPFKDENTQ